MGLTCCLLTACKNNEMRTSDKAILTDNKFETLVDEFHDCIVSKIDFSNITPDRYKMEYASTVDSCTEILRSEVHLRMLREIREQNK